MSMWYQSRIPAQNQINTITIRDFAGGLNNRSQQLADNEASELLNMRFTDNTLMERREGTKSLALFNPEKPIVFQDVYKPYPSKGEDDVPVIQPDQFLYASEDTLLSNGEFISSVKGKVRGTNYMGFYYFVDGDVIRMYGKFPQEEVAGNIVLVGTPVDAFMVMKLVNPPSGFTPAPAPAITGTWHYDYTNKETWYEPSAYEVADTAKGSNVLPEKPSFICVSQERLYISGSKVDDDNVFISDVNNGYYFPVYLPIQMPPNSDKVAGLRVFHDSVVIGREHDIHIIYGNTNRTDLDAEVYKLKRVNAHAGFASQEAMAQVTNYLFYLGSDFNIYSMLTPKTDTDMLVTTQMNAQLDLREAPFNFTKADLASASSAYFKDEWYLAIKDVVLVYSYRKMAWTVYKFSGYSVTSTYLNDQAIQFGTSDGDVTTFADDVFNDREMPYQSYWTSKNYDMGDSFLEKFFRDFFIVVHTFKNAKSTINMRFDVDYKSLKDSYDVVSQLSVFGVAKWGDTFNMLEINQSESFPIGARGRYIRIGYSNGYELTAKVATYDDLLDYRSNLKRGTLLYVEDSKKYYVFDGVSVWTEISLKDLSQPMKLYEINGQYEFRGRR